MLYQLAESLRILAILVSPVVPKAAHGIFDQLNWKTELAGDDRRFQLAEAQWGGLPDGHCINAPTPLFPRIETKPVGAVAAARPTAARNAAVSRKSGSISTAPVGHRSLLPLPHREDTG